MAGEADRHRYYEELAVSHVLGGLSESDGRVFRSHLMDCMDCRARVGELRRIANDLADVERDERRVRAAKAIETKRREDDDEVEADEVVPATRGSRLVLLLGLAILVGLTAWNYLLRDANSRLASNLTGAQITANLLAGELSVPVPPGRDAQATGGGDVRQATHTSPDGTFSAPPNRVLYDDSHAVIVLDGVEPGQVYAIYSLDNQDRVLTVAVQPPVVSSDMTLLVDRHADLDQLQVVEPDVFPPSTERVSGRPVLVAHLAS